MSTPTKQSKNLAKMLFCWCTADGTLDKHRAHQVVQGVLQSKHRGYVAVLAEFKRMVNMQLAKQTARVESAAHPPPGILSIFR